LRRLVRTDQVLTARLLVHLGEVDARGLYREHAFHSMFAYAVEELHMSEAEAYLRIQTARLGRDFPLILRMLAKGELHLTAIKLVGPHLTRGNHVQVLERARFKGKREIELLVAELAPRPDTPSVMRKLPERMPTRTSPAVQQKSAAPAAEIRNRELAAQANVGATTVERNADGIDQKPTHQLSVALSDDRCGVPLVQLDVSVVAAGKSRDGCRELSPQACVAATDDRSRAQFAQTHVAAAVDRTQGDGDREHFQLKAQPTRTWSTTPLRPGRYEIKFTTGQAMQGKLEQLQNLLRHQVPDGNIALILERAADLLLEETMKQRFAQNTRRRSCGVRSRESTGVSGTRLGKTTTECERIDRAVPSGSTGVSVSQLTASTRSSEQIGATKPSKPHRETSARVSATATIIEQVGAPEPSEPNESRGEIRGRSSVTRRDSEQAGSREAISPHESHGEIRGRSSVTTRDSEQGVSREAISPHDSCGETSSRLSASTMDYQHATEPEASEPNEPAGETNSQLIASTREHERTGTTKRRTVASTSRATQTHSRYVPRSVVREVYERDGNQCTFVSPNGRRCAARGFLELHHHDTPFARGGSATAANLRTVCRAHNALFAERDFGKAFMQSKLVEARSQKRESNNKLGPARQQE
jgi:hypothetical protein